MSDEPEEEFIPPADDEEGQDFDASDEEPTEEE